MRALKPIIAGLAAGAGLAAFALPAAAQQRLDFILNWVPGGDHAPYYYAKKMGWYSKEGIDLNLEPGKGSALAKTNGIDPKSITWVNVDANAKLSALKSGSIDITTSFYNIHHIFQRELGDDMGFVAWRDIGLNPYGNSVIVNAEFLQKNKPVVAKFVKVTQRAFATCVKDPKPCVEALVEAGGALKFDNEMTNWSLVEVLMSDKFSREVALGWHDPKRMADDYALVKDYVGVDKPFDVKTVYTNEFLDKSVKMTK